jgi:hypothetical protein
MITLDCANCSLSLSGIEDPSEEYGNLLSESLSEDIGVGLSWRLIELFAV